MVVIEPPVHPISNVCRFWRDFRHSTDRMEDIFHRRWNDTNLQRMWISPDPRTKKGAMVLYVGSQKYVRVQNFHEGVELPLQGLQRTPAVRCFEAFPYPWRQSQPHRPTCHAQWSQRFYPPLVGIANPPHMLNAEPCIVAGGPWFWGDVRENKKDKFVWEFENCENQVEYVSIRPKGLM